MTGYSKPRLAVAAVAASAASLSGLAIGAGAANAATGATLNVGPNAQYKTISAGLAAAKSGDTVDVAAGTYKESVKVPAGVDLVSPTAGAASIQGAVTISGAAGAILDGFNITTGGTGAAITVSKSAGAIVRNNDVTNSGQASNDATLTPGVPATPTSPAVPPQAVGSNGVPAVYLNNAGAMTFTNNHVDGNAYHGLEVSGATAGGETISANEFSANADTNPDSGARYANGADVKSPNVQVLGNVFHDNQDSGLQFYPAADNGLAANNVVYNNGDHGIDDLGVSGGVIVNNTVYHNQTSGINVEGAATKYTIENNISVDNAYPGNAAGRSKGEIRIANTPTIAGNVTISNNLVYASDGTDPLYDWDTTGDPTPTTPNPNVFYYSSTAFRTAVAGQGVGDVTANPGFTSETTFDFHIPANSPAAGVANKSFASDPKVDFDSNAWAGSAGAFNAGSTGPASGGGGGTTPPPVAGNGPQVQRIAGGTRYETGIAMSLAEFPTNGSAPAVVLATGGNFPDALAGVPLAKKLGAPLILVPPVGDRDSAAVIAEINRVLKPGGAVYILGGQAALPNAALAGITSTNQTRLAGSDRFGTALDIATQGLGSPKNVVLATGLGFADALAAGPYAADVAGGTGGAAILLTDGSTLAPGDQAYLNGATSVAAAGGPAVAAAKAANVKLAASFSGLDRYQTTEMIDAAFPASAIKTAGVATSGATNTTQFADALTGAAFIANGGGPLVLTDVTGLPAPSIAALNGIAKALTTTNMITVFGGTSAINTVAAGQIVQAVGGTAVVAPSPHPL
jgi:Right handed beta helix region/ell wall binding domain 2 (CWB2)